MPRQPASERKDDRVRDEIRRQHPGGFVDRRGEASGDVGKRHVDDRRVEHLHEGGEHDGDCDEPRIDLAFAAHSAKYTTTEFTELKDGTVFRARAFLYLV